MTSTIPTSDGASAVPPTFSELLATYCDDAPAPSPISLTAILTGRDADPMKLIAYYRTLGIGVTRLDDLLLINDDKTEEELHAFQCAEGIALSIASDGIFVFFVP